MANILVNPGTTVAVATLDIGGGVESPRINLISQTGGTLYGSAGSPPGGTTVLTVQGAPGGTVMPISGAVTGTVTISGTPAVTVSGTTAISGAVSQAGTWNVGQSGTWTVQPGNTPNTTPWLVTLSSGTTAVIGAVTQSGVWTVGLSAGTNAIGTATALQGGTWNVGLSAGTNAIGTTTALQGTTPWVVGQGAGAPFGVNVAQIGTTAIGTTVGIPSLIRDGAGNARFAAVNPSNQLSVSVDGGSLSASISSTATLGVNITQIGTTTVASTGLFSIIRDAAGNARGANVNSSNQLSVSVDGGSLSASISATAVLGSNLVQVGTSTINIGQAAMAASLPVTLASNQSPVGLNIVQLGTTTVASTGLFSIIRDAAGNSRGANVNASNQLSVSVDGGTLNAQISSTATIRTNQVQVGTSAIDIGTGASGSGTQRVALATDSPGIITLGQGTMATSVPVVIASDQSPVTVTGSLSASFSSTATIRANIIQVGTATLNIGQQVMAASVPVAIASNQQSILTQPTSTATVGLNAGVNTIGTATALQGGTWTVGLSAGTNAVGTTTSLQGTTPWVIGQGAGAPLGINITQIGTAAVSSTVGLSTLIRDGAGNARFAGVNSNNQLSVSVDGGSLSASISATSILATNLVQVGTSTINIGQAAMAASLPVAIASNQSNVPVTITSGTTAAIGAVTQSGTWTVQPGNTQNTIPWLIQPVSTATIGLNAGVNAIGTATALQGGTWTVGLSAGTNAVGTMTALQGTTPWTVAPSGLAFPINITQIGTTAVSSTVGLSTLLRDGAGNARFANVNSNSQLSVSVDGGSLSASISATSILATNLVQVGTSTINIGQATMAASLPVAIASNQAAVPVTINQGTTAVIGAVTQSGTWTVQPGNTQNTIPWLIQPVSTAAINQAGTWTVQPGNTPNTSPWLVAPATGVPFPVNMTQVGTTNVVTAGVAGTQAVGGNVATNVAIGTNPINLGAQAISVENTAVTATRMVQLVADLTGKQIILPYANPENFVNGTAGAVATGINNTAIVTLLPAPGAGLRNYVTNLLVTNGHATVSTVVVIGDGSAAINMQQGYAVAAGGGFALTFPTPLRQPTTNTALSVFCVTTGSAVWVSASGYKGA